MNEVSGGELVANALDNEGTDQVFCLTNVGWSTAIEDSCHDLGIDVTYTHQEQAAAYMAEAWGKLHRRPGVVVTMSGPGLANAMIGIGTAHHAHTPMVVLVAGHYTFEDKRDTYCESYATEMAGSLTKWSHRVTEWDMIPFYVRLAFREAMSEPKGPALLELPLNLIGGQDDPSGIDYPDPARTRSDARPLAEEERVEEAVETVMEAESPVIVAGDGLYWSNGADEIGRLARAVEAPVILNRNARGALRSDDEYLATGRYTHRLQQDADVILTVGFRFWWGSRFGEPPYWPEDATYVQIDRNQSELGKNEMLDLGLLGDPARVLEQMIDYVESTDRGGPERHDWFDRKTELEERSRTEREEDLDDIWDDEPIHPLRFTTEVLDLVDDDASILFDGASTYMWARRSLEPTFMGQIVDAGPFVPIGQGVPMAVAVQKARSGDQVVVFQGDGSFGFNPIELETAVREELPIVVALANNDGWAYRSAKQHFFEEYGEEHIHEFQPKIEWDTLAEALGCHGEYVERPAEIAPAFERAFEAEVPSLVNVILDKEQVSDLWPSVLRVFPDMWDWTDNFRSELVETDYK